MKYYHNIVDKKLYRQNVSLLFNQTYIYIYIYIYMCVCMYVCIYIYIYIYIKKKQQTRHIRIINLFLSCYALFIDE